MICTDCSKDGVVQVRGGWHASGNGDRSVAVGTITTLWDGKVAGIPQALRMAPEIDILVLSNSTAALQPIKTAAHSVRGTSRDLVEVVDEVGILDLMGPSTRFCWVKAHVGIDGNERVDLMRKAGCRESLLPQMTESGVRAYLL